MRIYSLRRIAIASIAAALLLFSTAAFANDDPLLSGFDEDVGETGTGITREVEDKKWDIDGFISLSSSYNYAHKEPQTGHTDYRGLSRLRAKLFLEFDYEITQEWKFFTSGFYFHDFAYGINGRNSYTDNVLRVYEDETELGELYLQGTVYDDIDIKVGRQIVVWGKSDNIRITDILNPLDNREPGMVDIENLRLPLAMTRIDYYIRDWGLSLISIHEKRFNKNPALGSDFNRTTAALPEEIPPGNEFAASLNGIFSGWDISFYAASIYNDQPGQRLSPAPKQIHDRLAMTGIATNIAFGNWLVKTEAAYFDGLKYANYPGKVKTRTDILGGIEYQGLTDQSISIEMANRHINGFEKPMEDFPDYAEQDDFQTAFRYTGDFFNSTITVKFLAIAFGKTGDGGGFQRISAEYDWYDSLKITTGIINYTSGSKAAMSNIENNDRIFLEGKYSF